MGVKRVLKPLARAVLQTPLPELVFKHRSRRRLTVLAYHRILPLPGAEYPFDNGVISASPEEFRREVRYFRRHLDLISMPELVEGLKNPGSLPPRPAVITFDDGYHDNYDTALPVLKEEGVSATFFLASRIVGTSKIPWWDYAACCLKRSRHSRIPSPFGGEDPPYQLDAADLTLSIRRFLHRLIESPWEKVQSHLDALAEATGVQPEEYLERPLFMTWDDARRMKQAGMDMGGHTRSHPIVGRMSDPDAVREEIQGGYEDILGETGQAPLAFAYPVGRDGALSELGEKEVRRAGFSISFSYINGTARLESPLHLPCPRVVTEFQSDYEAFRLGMLRVPTFALFLFFSIGSLLQGIGGFIGAGSVSF